jgi:adenosine kinase
MATVGSDFAPYAAWLRDCGLSADYIRQLDQEYTAQAYITTDSENNQITAFHPGAMNHAASNHVPANVGLTLGIVAPESRDGMTQHAAEFHAAGIPFVFDPGQGMTLFDGAELRRFIEQASWVAANDYEASLLAERTGWSLEQIATKVRALIVTRGGDGSHIYAQGKRHDIPSAQPARIADPTGCGDAYRAGLLYGLQRQLDWPTLGRVASLMGALKIEHHGTQNHRFTMGEFRAAYRANFGAEMPESL